MASHLLLLVCLSTSMLYSAEAYKVLFVAGNVGSHMMYVGNLAGAFVDKGHDVSFLVADSAKIPADIAKINMTTFRYHCPELPVTNHSHALLHEMAFNPSFKSQMKMLSLIGDANNLAGYHLMADETALSKLAAARFDYVVCDPIVMSFLMLPYKLGVPYGLLIADCFASKRRIPLMPSYTPSIMTSYTDQMTFPQRVVNFIFYVIIHGFHFSAPDVTKKYIPEKPATSFDELFRNASLCLQLRDNMIDFVRPEMPDVIPMSMVMARPAQALPGDLEQYMQSSKHGVILLSFGSNIRELPDDTLQAIFDALGNIKQNVIFKYPEELPNAPSNVRVMNWVPQNDLLGHPKLKLFITHCGMNSLIEAVYHGVPLLGFPFALDQHSNGALVRGKGIGEIMALHDFTAQELKDNIVKVISDGKYAAAAKKMSAVYQDVKKSGLRDPVYWVEHVIKHGAKHLRTHAYDMPDYQYFMIDVIVFISVSMAALVGLMLLMIRCLIRCMCAPKKEKSKSE